MKLICVGLTVVCCVTMLTGCGASKAKTDSVAPLKIKPFELPWPNEGRNEVYDSGCAWMTLKGDAIVCFNNADAQADQPAAMAIHGVGAAPSAHFELYVFQRSDEAQAPQRLPPQRLPPQGVDSGLIKSTQLAAAQGWLASHPIIKVDVRAKPTHAITPDKATAIVAMDGQRLATSLPPLSKRYAPTSWTLATVQKCCAHALKRVIEMPNGVLVAALEQRCEVDRAADHACYGVDETKVGQRETFAALAPFKGTLPKGTVFQAPVATKAVPKRLAVSNRKALLDPTKATLKAPAQFTVEFETDVGAFSVRVNRAWAPNGADRLYNLVQAGFFTDVAIFRAIKGFMFQFGIHGSPHVSAAWKPAVIPDDPVRAGVASNIPGTLTFATAGPGTRTTQLFINLGNNARLDGMGFSPVGMVVSGIEAVRSVNTEYGEGAPAGKGPSQQLVQAYGNTYLRKNFPRLTRIKSAHVHTFAEQ